MANISLKGKQIYVSGKDSDDIVPTVNWLLDHGARVTIVGARKGSEMEKRIDQHLKRTASDGKAYEQVRARLAWTDNLAIKPTNLYEIFLSVWKKRIIGITGKHGKTTTAVWAAHLIGDAVVVGHTPDRPLLPAADSKARVAVIKIQKTAHLVPKFPVVSTDSISNLDAAIEAAHLAGVPEKLIQQRRITLPQVSLRQEVIYESPKLVVVNDALATEPTRGIFALRRWGGPTCVLICGGTDRELDYHGWADAVRQQVRPTNLILLDGSATQKMRAALGTYGRGIRAYDSLETALKAARARAELYVSSVILFSPAAKSFELFANEYDRGQQFNALIQSRK